MDNGVLDDRRYVARAGFALLLANLRYWSSVAPTVRREIAGWRSRAEAIEDPELRALALSKLHTEGFHAEAAAMLATLAPRLHRDTAVKAIVALELLFDYLDGLTENLARDPLGEGKRLFGALIDAVALSPSAQTTQPRCGDGGYLEALSHAVAAALARLPATPAIREAARKSAERSAQAQTRTHAAPQVGSAQLEAWAKSEVGDSGLGWRELVAGSASSVLALHALVAAAADPRTVPTVAARIPESYISICVLLTLLDGLVDFEQDTPDGSGPLGYLRLYEDSDELAEMLGQRARRAARQARSMPRGPTHLMIMVGAVAYYSSAPGAENDLARPVVARLADELKPLFSPTLGVMRVWRTAKRRKRTSGAVLEGQG